MKYIFVLFVLLAGCSKAKIDEQTVDTIVCNHLAAEIGDRFIKSGLDFPVAWDDFEFVMELKNRKHGFRPNESRVINRLTLVPGAPLIEKDFGLNEQYTGYQLLAISRRPSLDYSDARSPTGRYVILASRERKQAWATWISDDQAEKVLNELKKFDPLAQPLAFPNIAEDRRDADVRDKNSISVNLSRPKSRDIPQGSPGGQLPNSRTVAGNVWMIWCIIGITLVLIPLIVRRIAFRPGSSRKDG